MWDWFLIYLWIKKATYYNTVIWVFEPPSKTLTLTLSQLLEPLNRWPRREKIIREKSERLNSGIKLWALTTCLIQLYSSHHSYWWTGNEFSPLIYLFILLSSIKPTYFSSAHQTLIEGLLCGSSSAR